MSVRRLFIGVDISDEARRRAAAHIDEMRVYADGVRVGWERPDKLHVTLKFLGNVEETLVDDVSTAAASAASGVGPFEMSITTPGVFPDVRRPRVQWLGVGDSAGTLQKIAEDLDVGLLAREDRSFSPHLTIARVREPQKAKRLAEIHLQSRFKPIEFTVTELIVYESQLTPTGSVYSIVSRHAL